MDLKKLLRLLGIPEQFFTSKSKVFSGFGLGVIASILLLTVVFLNHPLKTSFLYPVFQGFNSIGAKAPIVSWPFQFPTSSGSFNSSGLKNFTDSNVGGDGVLQNDHDGIVVERSKNGSSLGNGDVGLGKNQGIDSTNSKNSSLIGGNLAPEKPLSGNNESFSDSSGGKLKSETTQNRNFSGSSKNASNVVNGGGDLVSGRINGGNDTAIPKNMSSSGEVPTFNSTYKSGKEPSVESNKSAGKSSDSVHGGNSTTDSGVSVRSNDTKGSNVGKNQAQNSTKEEKVSGSNDSGIVDFAKCDIFDGRWVRDEGKPYYPAGSCPYIDRDFDCHLNGRPDSDYLKWRWQPNHCNIPSLNATDFLERLRGQKLVFVGDSLNRNMWESLVCILRHSVANKKKVYEISGKHEFKKKGLYAFYYEQFNCSIDFVSSPFLVRETPITNKKGLKESETLRLDLMDVTSSKYLDADVIVFNTGHWWTHEKTSKGENYYQEGNHVYPTLKVMVAYEKALTTWARWVDKNVDAKRSQVFFRGYSVTHFKGGQWNSGGQCHQEIQPIFNDTYLVKYPGKMKTLEHVLQKMKTPVGYLNISKLTDYRKDAHPSIYRKEYETAEEKRKAVSSQDCSHWCLPGVPDTWNELLYASLLQNGRGSWKN